MTNSSSTLLETVQQSLAHAARYNAGDVVAPAAVLWTDADAQRRAVIEQLRALMPYLLTLGDYNPATRVGPAIWLRCVIEPCVGDEGTSCLPNGRKGAGILRYKPNIMWGNDRGKEPGRRKADYPWFWDWGEQTKDFMGGKTFDGNRWNDCHYRAEVKRRARKVTEEV